MRLASDMKIVAKAPLRIGLAGGGTDLSPYCDLYGGNVLNATIARYAYTTLKENYNKEIKFKSYDLNQVLIQNIEDKVKISDSLLLHKAVYKYMIAKYNNNEQIGIELATFCDAPIGSGLGSSSTIVVSLVCAFLKYFKIDLDTYEIAHLAYKIERIDCKLAGGRQDQFAAAFGGINFMEFHKNNKVIVNPLRINESITSKLETSLILYSTKVSRHSYKIIEEQKMNVERKLKEKLEAMHKLKEEAILFKEYLLKDNLKGIINALLVGWKNKIVSAKSVTNEYIDEIYRVALSNGAEAGKISGAGGGGFLIFFVPIEKRKNLIKSFSKYKGEFSNCVFTTKGCEAWIERV
tara:strand:+ start:6658 stop:7707 length:1050 start_codon:yes stop_codon:yes gene_type:complete